MQSEDKMQTEDRGKRQTADYRHFKYTSCYFHYQVLTVNRVIHDNNGGKVCTCLFMASSQ